MAGDGRRKEWITKRCGKLEQDGNVRYVACGNDCMSVITSEFNYIL